jgi:hypothetical protein
MRKIDWKTIFNIVITMFGVGITGVSFTLTPYTITLNPILLIGGIGLIILGLYKLSSETK